MVYLFLLAIPIVGLLVIRAFYRDFAGLGEWLWFQDEYDAISQSIDQFGQSSYLYIQAIPSLAEWSGLRGYFTSEDCSSITRKLPVAQSRNARF